MAFAVSVMANSAAAAWQAFDGDVLVGVDADVAGDLHGFAGDRLCIQGIDVDQGARRRQRERPAGADSYEAVLRLQHVAVPGEKSDERRVGKECGSSCWSRTYTMYIRKNQKRYILQTVIYK